MTERSFTNLRREASALDALRRDLLHWLVFERGLMEFAKRVAKLSDEQFAAMVERIVGEEGTGQ